MVEKNEKVKQILSEILPSGEILETIYDPSAGETRLVVSKNGSVNILEKYTDSKNQVYLPLSNNHDFLTKKFLRLASGIAPYGTPTELFNEIDSLINKYMQIPNDFRAVCSLYVIFTWVFDKFHTVPYLRVVGDLGTGKTRFEQIMSCLCYKTTFAGGSISISAVFRSIDMVRGTFIFDEADFKNSEIWSEVTKILNSGHTSNSPVIRMEVKKDGDMKIKTFNVFGPKILASRERFGDTALESRCLSEQLIPMKNTDRAVHLGEDFEKKSELLRNKLLSFRLEMYHKIKADEATVKEIELPRLKQSALALTSIASIVGEVVSQKLIYFLKRYELELQNMQGHEVKADVLLCILSLLQEEHIKISGKIYMQEIKKDFERKLFEEYSERNDKRQGISYISNITISARKIGVYVRGLGIKTERDHDGFYIPIQQDIPRIMALAQRYGFDQAFIEKANEEKPNPLDAF